MRKKNQPQHKHVFLDLVRSAAIAMAIALLIRAFVIYPFRIPTASMEETLLVGDHLLANKFVYGLRTPDWVGIPATRWGVKVPYLKLPGIRKPSPGDVIIFKFPRDDAIHYVKRCVAVSGDTVSLRGKDVIINGALQTRPDQAVLSDARVYSKGYDDAGIYPPGAGNRDWYGPVRVPAPGDTFHFTGGNRNRWFERFQVMVFEGAVLEADGTRLTADNLVLWPRYISTRSIEAFCVDGHPLTNYVYTVSQPHYFVLGDNRDISLDSRYWGFVPDRLVVGQAMVIYFSWDNQEGNVRWNRIFKIIR